MAPTDDQPTIELEEETAALEDVTTVDEWTPPTKEEWEAAQGKLRTASGEAAARRKYLKAHGIDPKTGNKIETDPDVEPVDDALEPVKAETPRGASKAEVDRAIRKAAADAEIRGIRKTKTLVTGINEGLSAAGWNGTRLDLLMHLIDIESVDVDEDGEVTGLDEQIESAKRKFPEGFKRSSRNPAIPATTTGGSGQNGVVAAKVDAADKKAPAPEPKNWAERVARQATRGA